MILKREFLISVYGDLLMNVNEIDLDGYEIEQIDKDTFKGLINLKQNLLVMD